MDGLFYFDLESLASDWSNVIRNWPAYNHLSALSGDVDFLTLTVIEA